ncbi:hypothetical protein CQ062_22495 [Ochrobactrum sp. MYb68]|nr:hypothetical protein CQ062_22495 [Ochrobactrum sp. MYb68]
MSRRRIAEIAPISATVPSCVVDVGRTTSITSDPDGRWIATRQSAITAGLEQRRVAHGRQDQESAPKRFSDESGRIGTWVWNENTPFGKRYGYL